MSWPERGDASARGAHHAATSVLHECLRIQSETPPRGAIAIFFGRSPLRHDAKDWYQAAVGQVAVSSQLRELGPGWTTLQSAEASATASASGGAADVDHLVIGPLGVFSITTVVADGRRVTVAADTLSIGRHRSDALARAAARADAVAAGLSAIAGAPITVTPVVAVVGATLVAGASTSAKTTPSASTKSVDTARAMPAQKKTPQQSVTVPDVIPSKRLVRWLSLRPAALTSAAVVGISTIAATAGWTVLPAITDDGARAQQRFERLRRDVETAKRRRTAWIIAATAIAIGAIGLGVLLAVGTVMGSVVAVALT